MRKNLINWLIKKKRVYTGNYLKDFSPFQCLMLKAVCHRNNKK